MEQLILLINQVIEKQTELENEIIKLKAYVGDKTIVEQIEEKILASLTLDGKNLYAEQFELLKLENKVNQNSLAIEGLSNQINFALEDILNLLEKKEFENI